jgi:DNA modification methylase
MSLPKPYYQDSAVTLYHGDCREIVPLLGRFDMLLTDPPFGVGNFVQITGNKRGDEVTWNEAAPTLDEINALKSACAESIVWGANFMNCFDSCGGAIVWVKNQPMPNFSKADIAACSFHKKTELVKITWTNFVNTKTSDHPCERPVALYAWCLENYSKAGESVLDPFSGSGSVGRACKDLGRKCVMIEREERYCEIAARRMGQEVLNLT